MIIDKLIIPHTEGRDLSDVAQTGFIDLRQVFANSAVPSDIEGVEGNFNGIDNPESIAGKPDDVFSAQRASEVYSKMAKSAKADSASSSVSHGSGESE